MENQGIFPKEHKLVLWDSEEILLASMEIENILMMTRDNAALTITSYHIVRKKKKRKKS